MHTRVSVSTPHMSASCQHGLTLCVGVCVGGFNGTHRLFFLGGGRSGMPARALLCFRFVACLNWKIALFLWRIRGRSSSRAHRWDVFPGAPGVCWLLFQTISTSLIILIRHFHTWIPSSLCCPPPTTHPPFILLVEHFEKFPIRPPVSYVQWGKSRRGSRISAIRLPFVS